jgi:hypothetical protein
VHALRTLHEALVPGGMLVDTQPLSPRPPVFSGGERLGTLDMREWARIVRAVDEEVAKGLAEGLFELRDEDRFVVQVVFDGGEEFLEIVGEWDGTRIPPRLAAKVREAAPPLSVEMDVRLRLFSKPG